MERYSKIYKSKWQSQYSDEFKRKICQEYLDGTAGLHLLERKYKLGNSRLTCWLKSYGLEVKKTIYLPYFPAESPLRWYRAKGGTLRHLRC